MMTSPTSRWSPKTDADHDVVLRELGSMLASHHFKNSKRYPALLNYLVLQTLEGQAGKMKERTLGVEVFGRPPDYDTNADPVVRVTAAEIRKKIAQFYHERGPEQGVQIDLPLGSYVPEFKLLPATGLIATSPRGQSDKSSINSIVEAMPRETAPESSDTPSVRSRRVKLPLWLSPWLAWALIITIPLSAFALYALHQRARSEAIEQFWGPALSPPGTVLAVVPSTRHVSATLPSPATADLVNASHGPYDRISVSDAVALSRFASVLGKRSKAFEVKEANLTSLNDMHERSAILLGAINNHWTLRLTEPLRFHFHEDPSLISIVDTQNPHKRLWEVDYTQPYAFAKRDYALIARYKDPTTGGNIVIIAGIGAQATQAASEFVATPKHLEQIRNLAPKGWEQKNLEMVVETDIINGDPGPPRLLVVTTW
jgi:hypothetical protein